MWHCFSHNWIPCRLGTSLPPRNISLTCNDTNFIYFNYYHKALHLGCCSSSRSVSATTPLSYRIFQVLPFAMLVQSATGAAAQYGCYAYDGALTLEFTKSTSNGTTVSTVPREAELALNVLRFTSLTHIYYMMFLIFDIQCIIFFTVVHSQNRFNGTYSKYVMVTCSVKNDNRKFKYWIF